MMREAGGSTISSSATSGAGGGAAAEMLKVGEEEALPPLLDLRMKPLLLLSINLYLLPLLFLVLKHLER
ncbi:hypothetical protein C2S51_020948 [Perilla frutescens var. frutescens]|nr:hypothetical protein C2S51_020948 [Perilla frutescens var. frutescens]